MLTKNVAAKLNAGLVILYIGSTAETGNKVRDLGSSKDLALLVATHRAFVVVTLPISSEDYICFLKCSLNQ